MDKVIFRYENNGSARYDKKEYLESVSKIHREKSATGSLQISESVIVKTKSRIWKAIVVLYFLIVAHTICFGTLYSSATRTSVDNPLLAIQ